MFAQKVVAPFVLPLPGRIVFFPGVLGTLNVAAKGQVMADGWRAFAGGTMIAVGTSAAATPVEAGGKIRLAVGKHVTWQSTPSMLCNAKCQ